MNPMPDPGHASEPLQVDVQQVADVRPFVALHRRRRLEEGDAIQARPRQDAGDRRARHAEGGTDLPRRRPGPTERHDRRLERGRHPPRLSMRARGAVG
ncbi:MAG: hypothetical protein Q8L75_04500 [Acidobacteriota bacterium]|nr:hypothetical protein [Acidobacteriota bacterium]